MGFFLAAGVAAFLVHFGSAVLESRQRVVLAIVAVAVVLWVSEVIPLYITSLISSFLLIVVAGFGTQEIFQPYDDLSDTLGNGSDDSRSPSMTSSR